MWRYGTQIHREGEQSWWPGYPSDRSSVPVRPSSAHRVLSSRGRNVSLLGGRASTALASQLFSWIPSPTRSIYGLGREWRPTSLSRWSLSWICSTISASISSNLSAFLSRWNFFINIWNIRKKMNRRRGLYLRRSLSSMDDAGRGAITGRRDKYRWNFRAGGESVPNRSSRTSRLSSFPLSLPSSSGRICASLLEELEEEEPLFDGGHWPRLDPALGETELERGRLHSVCLTICRRGYFSPGTLSLFIASDWIPVGWMRVVAPSRKDVFHSCWSTFWALFFLKKIVSQLPVLTSLSVPWPSSQKSSSWTGSPPSDTVYSSSLCKRQRVGDRETGPTWSRSSDSGYPWAEH